MRKIRNRIKLMMACAALSVACVGAGAMISGYASTAAEITSDPFFVAGASVKYVHDISEQINQDGLRFAIVVENEEFNSWLNAEQTDFAEGISVGASVLPKDLANGEELTPETDKVHPVEFRFEDFSDSIYEEYSNAKIAYVYLYDIEPDSYNRDYMVSAYQVKDGKTTYTKSVARSMAYVAHSAIKAGDENREMLQGYIKQYPVDFYIDGELQSNAQQGIRYGDKIDTEKLPKVDASLVTWYADESFETEFDFEQEITGTTHVYGKAQKRAEFTDGVFSYVDNDYSVSGSGADLTLTQTLMNSSKKLGLAKFNVDGTKDYEVSAKISLSTPGAETWIENESNTRVGLAFYGEDEGANSYIYSYRAGNTVFIRNTNGANELYSDTTDDGRRSFWNERRDYLSDGTTEFTMKLKKLGASISVYINGKLLETLTVESGANLVPAIFSYTFENFDGKVTVTYSNISVCTDICETCGYCADVECTLHAEKCVGVLEYFGKHTSDYKAVKDGNGSWTVSQALGKGGDGKGLAYLDVGASDNYSISVDIKLSNNPATAAQGVNDGVDMRVGFALIGENGENYRFLFRGTQCALIYYKKSTELYELRSGNEFAETEGAVTYVYGKTNSTPKEPKLVLQNTGAINGTMTIKLTLMKVGNKVAVLLNGEYWNTFELEEGFAGVPAILSYSLDGKQRSHAYTNLVIKEMATCEVCGLCAETECVLHTEKCVNTLGYFGEHTSDYKAVKDVNGNWTVKQALSNGKDNKGLAYFNVDANADYTISVDVNLSGNPATAAQDATVGADMRVGFALINKNGENSENSENYRFLFRGTQCALIYYDKSTELYELRSGNAFAETTVGEVTYVYGKENSTPKAPKLVLQNTNAINGTTTIKLKMEKDGNTLSVYLNGELWTTKTLEEGFEGVPALLCYELDGKGGRTHTYSNIVITTGTANE